MFLSHYKTLPIFCFMKLAISFPTFENSGKGIIIHERVFDFLSIFHRCTFQFLTIMEESDPELIETLVQVKDFFSKEVKSSVVISTYIGFQDTHRFISSNNSSDDKPGVYESSRFQECHAQLISPRKKSSSRNTPFLKKFRGFLNTMKENPDFVMILSSQEELGPSSTRIFSKIPTTGKLILIQNWLHIDFINVPSHFCPDRGLREKLVPILEPQFDRGILDVTWNNLNKDLHQGTVLVQDDKTQSSTCSFYHDGLNVPARYCIVKITSQQLNFTTVINRDPNGRISPNVPDKYVGVLAGGYLLDPNLISHIHNQSIPIRYDWIRTAEEFQYITFLLVVDIRNLNIAAIWQSLDLPTWTCIFLSAITVSATVFSLLIKREPSLFPSWCSAFTAMLAYLIEKSRLTTRTRLECLNIQSILIINIWAQLAMVISSYYKGALFALMTSATEPAVPQSMRQLLLTQDYITSATSYCEDNLAGSLLHLTARDFLKEGKIHHLGDLKTGNDLRDLVTDFKEKLKFLNASIMNILVSQLSQPQDLNYQEGVQFPHNYVFMGSTKEIKLYGLFLSILQSKTMVLQGPEIFLFLQRRPFVVKRNFLKVQFTSIAFKLVEAGIWNHWNTLNGTYNVVDTYKGIKGSVCTGDGSFNNRRDLPQQAFLINCRANIMAVLFDPNLSQTSSYYKDETYGSLPLSLLQFLFLGLGGGLLISGVVLVFEKAKTDTIMVLSRF
ncbi:unnamed protein product [Allacma fusca]|uniref:Uncharacterized protein n=1 Tax=Allacma fusca TaxID=39272 RepID=A0A8J2KRH6_9HEXA|nr:unnamed protein product [Allacma fusca]